MTANMPIGFGKKYGARAMCGSCVHFDASASALEVSLPGVAALGSIHGSARSDDGTCQIHQRCVHPRSRCGHYLAR